MIAIPHADNAPVPPYWRILLDGKRASATLICPDGHRGTLLDHKIDENGVVTPSAVCPAGCGWHAMIRLENWRERAGALLACFLIFVAGCLDNNPPSNEIRTLRFVGDSITAAGDCADPRMATWGSFRHEVWEMLHVEHVGSQREVCETTPDPDHDGYLGFTTSQVLGVLAPMAADAAVIELGTNDLDRQWLDGAGVIAERVMQVAVLAGARVTIIVAVQAMDRGAEKEPVRVEMNRRLEELTRAAGYRFVPQVYDLADLVDTAHPGPVGAAKLGAAVVDALR